MTNQNALSIPGDFTTNQHDLAAFKEVSRASDWLSRFQLFGANSDAVKKGQIPMAHYGIAGRKDDIRDLGAEVSAIPINWRPLALDFSNREEVINIFDRHDPLFKEISDKSYEQDSDCVFGPQFLMWLPAEREFVLFHMNSKTARNESPKVLKLLGKHTTFKSKLIETSAYSWHAAVAIPNPLPVTAIPDENQLRAEVEKFLNPPAKQVEKPEVAETPGPDRVR